MQWIKKGLIFEPKGQFDWMHKYGSVPTPIFLENENIIRIFFTTSSNDNIGRVTYLDLDASNPSKVIKHPDKILLREGEPGTFDDCGINPSTVILKNGIFHLYYIGYQRSYKVPYTLFPGLAFGNVDSGFKKLRKVPIMDRTEKYPYSFAGPFVTEHEGKYKMWLWIANGWTKINSKDYLSAQIGYAESDNGVDWKIIKDDCIVTDPKTEFSIGRPWVVIENGLYKLFYSVRYIDKFYRLGYAESHDGLNWTRKDNEIGIDVSETGWDSEMICYSAVVSTNQNTYMFYNGNNHGATGFGYAILAK